LRITQPNYWLRRWRASNVAWLALFASLIVQRAFLQHATYPYVEPISLLAYAIDISTIVLITIIMMYPVLFTAIDIMSSGALYEIRVAKLRSPSEARLFNYLANFVATEAPSGESGNTEVVRYVKEALLFRKEDFEGWLAHLRKTFAPCIGLLVLFLAYFKALPITELAELAGVLAILLGANAWSTYERSRGLLRTINLLERVLNEPITREEKAISGDSNVEEPKMSEPKVGRGEGE
jgi:ABC-type multidrug transport system fused ATPase/permease subunit